MWSSILTYNFIYQLLMVRRLYSKFLNIKIWNHRLENVEKQKNYYIFWKMFKRAFVMKLFLYESIFKQIIYYLYI